eukprot:10155359-Alexandrium_andersonii.AAC.1
MTSPGPPEAPPRTAPSSRSAPQRLPSAVSVVPSAGLPVSPCPPPLSLGDGKSLVSASVQLRG